MKKKLALAVSALMTLGSISPVLASEAPNTNQVSSEQQSSELMSVNFTKKDFVDSLIEQGFEVREVEMPNEIMKEYTSHFEKQKSVPQRVTQATRFAIQIPVRSVPAAPSGTGTVPNAYNMIYTDYVTVGGFNYFVKVYEGSITILGASQYTFTKFGQSWSLINGDQGITFTTTGQFSYSYSAGLSVSAGWVGVSGSTGYTYYYSSVCETSTYNWPLVG